MKLTSTIGVAVIALTFAVLGAQGETIRGQVTNGTPGGKPVSGIQVVLQSFNPEGKVVRAQDGKTDTAGRFSFGVQAEKSGSASHIHHRSVVASWGGVTFESDPILATPGHPAGPVTLLVFDSTTDPGQISIQMHHVILQPPSDETESGDKDIWTVRELIALQNTGDKAYVGKEKDSSGSRRTVQFSLPRGYKDLQCQSGMLECCDIKTAAAVYDSLPVPPGTKDFQLQYLLPAKVLSRGWKRKVDYPTQSAMVVARGENIELSCPQFDRQKTTDLGGGKMTFITASELKPGTELKVSVRAAGLPTSNLPLLVGTIVGLCVIAAVAGRLMKTKSPGKPQTSKAPSREDLLDQIADLDDDFEAGKISKADYEKQRAQLKNLLQGQ